MEDSIFGFPSEALLRPYFGQREIKKSLDAERLSEAFGNLQSVIDEYVAEKLTPPSCWTAKTHEENKAIFELLVALVGDVPVSTIDGAVARHVKQTVQKLPPNMNKSPLYRNKSVSEVVAMNPADTLAVNSVNKYLNRISSLFDWAFEPALRFV
ncbi:MAG: hypothetical protein IPM80_09080 [Proteobacteria bacterium]|nr:hypothetical protein [Pseudomonadota bacterium]